MKWNIILETESTPNQFLDNLEIEKIAIVLILFSIKIRDKQKKNIIKFDNKKSPKTTHFRAY